MASFDKIHIKQIYKASEESIIEPGKSEKPLPKESSGAGPKLYVFRHGETFDNLRRIHSGFRDSVLTRKGIEQAKALCGKLKNKKIDICITSPLKRSKDTAKIALRHHKNVKFEVDSRIIERDYGILTGKSKVKLMKEDPQKEALYRRGYDTPPPKGESLKDVEERVFPFCKDIAERAKARNINIAVSCHGNSMRAIRRYFENLSILEETTMENPLGQDFAEYAV